MEIDPEEVNPNFTDKATRDYKLIRLALSKKDRKAYAKLMDYYKDALYFMLLKMTNNADDAEDLTIRGIRKGFQKTESIYSGLCFQHMAFQNSYKQLHRLYQKEKEKRACI